MRKGLLYDDESEDEVRGMRRELLYDDESDDESEDEVRGMRRGLLYDDEDMPVARRRMMTEWEAEGENAEVEDFPMVESIENLEDTRPVQESEEEPSDFNVGILPLTCDVQFDPLGSGSEFCGWSEDEERPHELTLRLGAGNQPTNYHQDRLDPLAYVIQIPYSKSPPDSTNSRKTSSATHHYLIFG